MVIVLLTLRIRTLFQQCHSQQWLQLGHFLGVLMSHVILGLALSNFHVVTVPQMYLLFLHMSHHLRGPAIAQGLVFPLEHSIRRGASA